MHPVILHIHQLNGFVRVESLALPHGDMLPHCVTTCKSCKAVTASGLLIKHVPKRLPVLCCQFVFLSEMTVQSSTSIKAFTANLTPKHCWMNGIRITFRVFKVDQQECTLCQNRALMGMLKLSITKPTRRNTGLLFAELCRLSEDVFCPVAVLHLEVLVQILSPSMVLSTQQAILREILQGCTMLEDFIPLTSWNSM